MQHIYDRNGNCLGPTSSFSISSTGSSTDATPLDEYLSLRVPYSDILGFITTREGLEEAEYYDADDAHLEHPLTLGPLSDSEWAYASHHFQKATNCNDIGWEALLDITDIIVAQIINQRENPPNV